MILAGQILAVLGLSYLGLELLLYWMILLAARRYAIEMPEAAAPTLRFIVLAACRDGAECLPGLAKTVADQDYPAELRRLYVVADNCADRSADIARGLGMGVYERNDRQRAGKGNALNDVLRNRLMRETFDVLLVLDVDARLDPHFLTRAARYFAAPGPCAVSGATFAKNPTESMFTYVGTIIQALLRLHQRGRAALGRDAALYGSHGYAMNRQALERLGWHTTTGQIAEDMELRLRCTLRGIPVRYAPDLAVYNDVTANAAEVHQQRRRWNSTYLPLIPQYAGRLLRRWFAGDAAAFDALFGLLLLPSWANLFLYLTLAVVGFAWLGHANAAFRGYAAAALALWVLDVAYFLVAFRMLGLALGWRELRGFIAHLSIRGAALLESPFFAHVKIWPPASHGADRVD